MTPIPHLPGEARPSNPKPYSEADVYAAVREFVLSYAQPALEPDHVVQGWQNRASLPEGINEYAVISVVSGSQHGTTVEEFSAQDPDTAQPGELALLGLIRVSVRIEFCGDDDVSRQRAQRLAVVTRSSVGTQFFNDRGMSSLYADDVQEEAFEDEAKQFVRRYLATIHLSVWAGDVVEVDYFDKASMSRVENVDVHHLR